VLRNFGSRVVFEPLEPRLVLNADALLISEFMAVNGDTLADGHNEYPDWVEIYNPTDAEVPLDGWYLTDEAENRTKWEFPENASVAANDYLIVFASDKHLNAPPGELHTNFKLDGDGEYLALVRPDGHTIAHAYSPRFPPQLEDVSYGLPGTTTLREEFVTSGVAVSYHVPGPDDDLFAWTEVDFDDSAWVNTITLDPAGLLITEIATGETRIVEIQNVSPQAIDTTGWTVLVNDASSGVNGVNSVAWNLPTSVDAGVVLQRTDDSGEAEYWGGTIDWQPEGPGWAMVLDGGGNVMDFVAWGYTAAEIASLDIGYGSFTNITVGDQFSGDGAAVGTTAAEPATGGFVAFNDHIRGGGTHANTTTYTPIETPSGRLKDVATGQLTDVTLTTSHSGVSWEGAHGNPAAGTDAHDVFHGYVDFYGASGGNTSIAIAGDDHYTHTFTDLDTGEAVTYSFTGTTVRGKDYTDRWTLVTLQGADSATAAHSSGTGVVVVSPTEVAIWTGENHRADQGFVAAWTNIDPGVDGQFSVVSTQYQGNTPFGLADGSKGYGLAGIRLEEVASLGPLSFLNRTGNIDTDTAGEFVRTTESSVGAQNPDLTVPFGTVIPATTGVGFSDNQPAFESNIQTDVYEAMHDVNASLWMRIEFEAGDVSQFDELTLRMKCDDAFVAYLNGAKVARKNEPDTLAYNSAASEAASDELAVEFQEFGIVTHLGSLRVGTNVLAIRGMNVDAGDDDFLILPELIATSTLAGPQYMTTPTPEDDNLEGAVGVVEDTTFSVDRGFFDEAFEVEITTDTVGAEIRYTTDGNAPTATTGTVYTGPILIDQTTTLRAAAYKTGYIATNVDTHTYLFLDDVIRQDGSGLPDTWGYGSNQTNPPGPDYAMDAAVVAANAATIHDDLKSIPTVSLVTGIDNWFGASNPEGIYVRSKSVPTQVSVELFTADGSEQFQVEGSAQIQGGGPYGTSADRWKSYKLSIRLKFKEVYGDSKLRYPLYGKDGAQEFDTLILDAQLNQTWVHPSASQQTVAKYIQDQYMADLQNAMGGWGPHGRYVHLYLNGIYWGMYTLHERPDEHFAAAYLGGDSDDYDVLKHNANEAINPSPPYDYIAEDSFDHMLALAGRDLSNAANYEAVTDVLDIDAFIEYMLANFYGGNTDWSHKNWYASSNREDPDGRWRFHSWDAEHVLKDVTENRTGLNQGSSPTWIHQQLKDSAEYRLRFADRVHEHFHNGGVLSPEGAAALYQARMTEVDRAIVGESARWGDNRRTGNAYTRDDWLNVQNDLLNNYFPHRTNEVLIDLRNQSDGRDLYPSIDAPVFRINGSGRYGGEVGATDRLSMTGSGTVYYTIDGSDPRLPGGAVNLPSARTAAGSFAVGTSTLVKARVLNGGEWSALSVARFVVDPAARENLVVSELNYNPHDPTPDERSVDAGLLARDFEFVELKNTSTATVDLQFVQFTEGIEFDFTYSGVTELAPGESVVVAANPAAFEIRYGSGLPVAGRYEGLLDNGGERIALLDWSGESIVDFAYNDRGAWPGRADGKGASLELINPQTVPQTEPLRTEHLQDGDNWRSSTEYGGSPGSSGSGPIGDVVVNEVLSHTDYPWTDTIELHNTTGNAIDVSGWYLSDSWGWASETVNGNYKKFRIPDGTTIPADGYLVFDEDDFNPTPLDPGPDDFALDGAHGDDVWLMEADAVEKLIRFVDHAEFGAAKNGESLGRYPNGTGDLVPMLSRTFDPQDGHNSPPRVGPVIISELQYNPDATTEDDDLEFIEIFNPTGQTIDLTNWRIRKGIDYNFSDGKLLPARSNLLVVPFDPDDVDRLTAFATYYDVDPLDVQIVGPYCGRLSDLGERVQLQRPDEPPADEPKFFPRLLEDEVIYGVDGSWPVDADGNDYSLNRVATDAWGNSGDSWDASIPTPGQADLQGAAEVVARYVFYNQSAFDDNRAAAEAQDDEAVDHDKTALLPGETAAFANYTSYSRGINGVMIDVDNLPDTAVLLAGDFEFRVGNSDTPDTWAEAPLPTSITVREGSGYAGSDRVTITWSDGAIENQWLQVKVLDTANTGLPLPDVFYFGNTVGESGDSLDNAKVNAADVLLARNNPRNLLNPAPIAFRCDFNRDRRVNATDMLIARDNQTHCLNALKLIRVPGEAVKAAGLESAKQEVSSVKIDWLYELELADSLKRPAKKDNSAKEAVEKFFLAY